MSHRVFHLVEAAKKDKEDDLEALRKQHAADDPFPAKLETAEAEVTQAEAAHAEALRVMKAKKAVLTDTKLKAQQHKRECKDKQQERADDLDVLIATAESNLEAQQRKNGHLPTAKAVAQSKLTATLHR